MPHVPLSVSFGSFFGMTSTDYDGKYVTFTIPNDAKLGPASVTVECKDCDTVMNTISGLTITASTGISQSSKNTVPSVSPWTPPKVGK